MNELVAAIQVQPYTEEPVSLNPEDGVDWSFLPTVHKLQQGRDEIQTE